MKANVRGWKHPTLSFCSLSLSEARKAYPHVSKWRRVWLGESVLVRRGREVVREWAIVERRKRRLSQKPRAQVALDDQIALLELRLAEARGVVEELKSRDVGGDWSYAGSLSAINATMAQVIDMLPKQR